MRRFLAVRQDNHGDVTLIGPALRALARCGDVVLACAPSGLGAARLLPGVADVLTVRAEWIASDPRPVDAACIEDDVRRYAALAIDEAFVFTSFHQSPLPTALLLRLAGVKRIAAISIDYPGSLLDTRVTVSDDIHEVERALALVGAHGYALPAEDDGRLRYRELPPRMAGLPPRYVVVQPGASVPARRWPVRKMAAAVSELCEDGFEVVVVGSREERQLCAAVVGASGALDLSGRTSYAQFAAIIRDADALVAGNSSGIHVASAVGTPVVTIFPPTIAPVRFLPWQTPYICLGDHTIPCAGCRARTCPITDQPCISNVSSRSVVLAVRSLVSDRKGLGYRGAAS